MDEDESDPNGEDRTKNTMPTINTSRNKNGTPGIDVDGTDSLRERADRLVTIADDIDNAMGDIPFNVNIKPTGALEVCANELPDGGFDSLTDLVERYDGKMSTRCDDGWTVEMYIPTEGDIFGW